MVHERTSRIDLGTCTYHIWSVLVRARTWVRFRSKLYISMNVERAWYVSWNDWTIPYVHGPCLNAPCGFPYFKIEDTALSNLETALFFRSLLSLNQVDHFQMEMNKLFNYKVQNKLSNLILQFTFLHLCLSQNKPNFPVIPVKPLIFKVLNLWESTFW